MNLAAWRLEYPEAAAISDPMAESFLARAAKSVAAVVFGDRYDEAHGCLTAHLLALSPYGRTARLQSEKGQTTYGMRYEAIKMEATSGLARVI